ncbi:DNA gyrase subunit B [Minicystis rosea]|nr:DNA gyrase subunit B [Minicystis rosea]
MTTDDARPAEPAVYTCESIRVLGMREAVRLRPRMYFGDTDADGLHRMVWVIIENALAEHVAGHAAWTAVTLHRHGALTVEDDGRGISVESVEVEGQRIPLLEQIVSGWGARRLRRSCLFIDGFHGVGLAAVSALCETVVVEVRRAGQRHQQSYRRGWPTAPVACLGPATGTGTRVTLHPDPTIFGSAVFERRRIGEMLRTVAFLNPGLRIEFVDEQRGTRETLPRGGIGEWIERLTEGQAGLAPSPIRLHGIRGSMTIDIALQWSRTRGARLRTFANQREIHTGSHVEGLYRGLSRAIARARKKTGLTEALGDAIPARLGEGLVAIVDVRGPSLSIGGQRNEVLEGDAVMTAVRKLVAEEMSEVLALQPALLDALGRLVTEHR